jgi:hypothetical protein
MPISEIAERISRLGALPPPAPALLCSSGGKLAAVFNDEMLCWPRSLCPLRQFEVTKLSQPVSTENRIDYPARGSLA